MGIWSDIAEGIADFAPSIAKTILPGPIGGLASIGIKKLTDTLGLTDEDAEDPVKVQNALKLMTPDQALALKKEDHEFKKTMKKLDIDLAINEDKQVTQRHSSDMVSDSWLSKNIRPLVLCFLTISTVLYIFCCAFWIPVGKVDIAKAFIPLLISLDGLVFTFYFGGRSIEKWKKLGNDLK